MENKDSLICCACMTSQIVVQCIYLKKMNKCQHWPSQQWKELSRCKLQPMCFMWVADFAMPLRSCDVFQSLLCTCYFPLLFHFKGDDCLRFNFNCMFYTCLHYKQNYVQIKIFYKRKQILTIVNWVFSTIRLPKCFSSWL